MKKSVRYGRFSPFQLDFLKDIKEIFCTSGKLAAFCFYKRSGGMEEGSLVGYPARIFTLLNSGCSTSGIPEFKNDHVPGQGFNARTMRSISSADFVQSTWPSSLESSLVYVAFLCSCSCGVISPAIHRGRVLTSIFPPRFASSSWSFGNWKLEIGNSNSCCARIGP